MGILICGWDDVVKDFQLKEETICVFDFVIENDVVHLVITAL
jgi:hypothetical protein